MRPNNGNSSSIKFGSWDQAGMAPGSSLTMFRTSNLDQWALNADDYSIDGTKFLVGIDKKIVFSPHLPYLYMPSQDWVAFAAALAKAYPDVHCVYDENRCSFQTSCSQIPKSSTTFDIRIFDVAISNIF